MDSSGEAPTVYFAVPVQREHSVNYFTAVIVLRHLSYPMLALYDMFWMLIKIVVLLKIHTVYHYIVFVTLVYI